MIAVIQTESIGFYPACTHRVGLPPNAARVDCITNGNGGRKVEERFSLIYFAAAQEDAVVAPLASLVERDGFARYEPVTFSEYAEMRGKWHYENHGKI